MNRESKWMLLVTIVSLLMLVACGQEKNANKQSIKTPQVKVSNYLVGVRDSSIDKIVANPSIDQEVSKDLVLTSSEDSRDKVVENPPIQDKAILESLLLYPETSEEINSVSGERTEVNPPISDPKILEDLLIVPNNSDNGERHLLSVSEQLQEVWNYCAPTTVSMMLSSRGIAVDQHQLAREMGTYDPFGTHNRDAIRILNKHLFGYEYPAVGQSGYRLETVTDVEAALPLFKERLMQNIKDGYPMYYTMDVSKVYPGKKGEHNVIGIGYRLTADGTDIAYIYYLDPSPVVYDSTYGALKILSPRELLTAMLTCSEPNYAW